MTSPTPPKIRVRCAPERMLPERAILGGKACHHIRNVLRLEPGTELVVFDGHGREAVGVIELYEDDKAIVRLLRDLERCSESDLDLTIAPCLAKGKKADLVIEKAVELGVTRISVVTSGRSVSRLTREAALGRVERWRRVAQAAAEQSGRTQVPVVDRLRPLTELLASKPEDTLGLVFTAGAGPDPPATLRQRYPDTRRVLCVVGPEGGLTPEEIEAARQGGFIPVGLGPRVLRAETAGIVAAAICQHLWGDLGRQPTDDDAGGGDAGGDAGDNAGGNAGGKSRSESVENAVESSGSTAGGSAPDSQVTPVAAAAGS